MENQKITRQEDLPDWFNMKKYEASVRYRSQEWFCELFGRSAIRILKKNDEWEHGERIWSTIQQDALITDYIKKNHDPAVFFEKLEDKNHEELNQNGSIKILNNFSLYRHLLNLDNKTIEKKVTEFLAVFFKEKEVSEKEKKKLWRWATSRFDTEQEGVIYVRVNLAAADEQIEADFKEWLSVERSRHEYIPPPKNFDRTDFLDWYEFGVLPYLDLDFWSQMTGIKIAQHLIAKTLFPESYDVDPVGKLKTTKKKAELLLKEEIYKTLCFQETS